MTSSDPVDGAVDRVAHLVVDLARRIARCPGGTEADLLAATGLAGALIDDLGSTYLRPPPDGASRLRLRGGAASLAGVELWPSPALTLGALDVALGGRQELPRVHWDSPHLLAYDVRVDRPPGRCTVFARVRAGTSAEDVVESVLLRTEPAP